MLTRFYEKNIYQFSQLLVRFLHYVITMPTFQADRLACSIQEVYSAIETKTLYKRRKCNFVT